MSKTAERLLAQIAWRDPATEEASLPKLRRELTKAVAAKPLRDALIETLALAEVSHDGDPWFAEEAKIDADAVIARARKALRDAERER